MSKLVIATFATERYDYALPSVGRRIVSAIHYAKVKPGTFLFIGDKSKNIEDSAYKYIRDILPEGWSFELIQLDLVGKEKNYNPNSQLLIAQMQSTAFSRAKQLNAKYFWSIESDVLVAVNSLRVGLDSIKYDDGYYDVCMCTYPSQGGGSFLGGFGDYNNYIYEDCKYDERDLPDKLSKSIDKHKAVSDAKRDEKWHKKFHDLIEQAKKYPPKDNVFLLNGKHWKKRGWMEYAYPALGKGCLLPTDWVGLGCTLLSRRALSLAGFEGYQGHGTQDLYLGYNFWKTNDVKMCVSTHAICDHVVRKINEDGTQDFKEISHIQAYHETDPDYYGHLRQRRVSFYNHIAGEVPHESPDSV